MSKLNKARRGFLTNFIMCVGGIFLLGLNKIKPSANHTQARLYYSDNHTWVKASKNAYTVGVTNHVQDTLGRIGRADLPDVGTTFKAGEKVGIVGSKNVFDVLMPVSGTVTKINERLAASPELINSHPYAEGWLLQVSLNNKAELGGLMDIPTYENLGDYPFDSVCCARHHPSG